MTSQLVAEAPRTAMTRRPRRSTVPAVAGIAFTASWVVGLLISSSSTDVRSTGAQVLAADAGHESVVATQFVFTEAAASVFLAVVAIALGRAGLRAGAGKVARLTQAAGVVAAAIALVQCMLGLYLTGSVVPAGHAGTAATLNESINRLDGLKMFVLAAMAVAGTVMARQTGVLPRWLRWTGVALTVAIIASGFGYALLNSALSVAAWVSLPLLLVFVTGAGIVLGRSER